MKRRQLLAGIGVNAVGPSLKSVSSMTEMGPVIFAQSDLAYEIESGSKSEIQGVHIDHPPEFLVRGQNLELLNFALDRTVELIKSRESVVNFRGIKELSDSIPEERTTKILPVDSGGRNQLSYGLALKNEITTPDFGLQKRGPKSLELRAFDQSIEVEAGEDVTLVGKPSDVAARMADSETSIEMTIKPKLSVSNLGVLTPRMQE